MALQPRRQPSSCSPPREPQILLIKTYFTQLHIWYVIYRLFLHCGWVTMTLTINHSWGRHWLVITADQVQCQGGQSSTHGVHTGNFEIINLSRPSVGLSDDQIHRNVFTITKLYRKSWTNNGVLSRSYPRVPVYTPPRTMHMPKSHNYQDCLVSIYLITYPNYILRMRAVWIWPRIFIVSHKQQCVSVSFCRLIIGQDKCEQAGEEYLKNV
jgi:hypothetical protein